MQKDTHAARGWQGCLPQSSLGYACMVAAAFDSFLKPVRGTRSEEGRTAATSLLLIITAYD